MRTGTEPTGRSDAPREPGAADLGRPAALVAGLAWPMAGLAAAPTPTMAAAWQGAPGTQVGLLAGGARAWCVAASLDVPTRAHGIVVEPEGTVIAVARRPGDWLLRFSRSGRALAWGWSDGARRFNGHARRRGALLYTTETDVDSGEGRVVVRDARSFAVQAVWSSGGVDPHDLCVAPDGTLWVANGGIATQPETGRVKRDLDRMDASLVQLDASGRLRGRWRLDDARLSLRHLALREGRIGIALQAEHDDAAERAAAPVLAWFDGARLRTGEAGPFAGYGGDIAATPGGFAVSVPRAHGVALFGADGRSLGQLALAHACALAADGPRLLAGGRDAVLTVGDRQAVSMPTPALRLDNHWQPA